MGRAPLRARPVSFLRTRKAHCWTRFCWRLGGLGEKDKVALCVFPGLGLLLGQQGSWCAYPRAQDPSLRVVLVGLRGPQAQAAAHELRLCLLWLQVNLSKVGEYWWNAILEGEEPIDIDKINKERSMATVDEEEQAVLDRLTFDYHQKLQGKPQSHELVRRARGGGWLGPPEPGWKTGALSCLPCSTPCHKPLQGWGGDREVYPSAQGSPVQLLPFRCPTVASVRSTDPSMESMAWLQGLDGARDLESGGVWVAGVRRRVVGGRLGWEMAQVGTALKEVHTLFLAASLVPGQLFVFLRWILLPSVPCPQHGGLGAAWPGSLFSRNTPGHTFLI